MEQEFSEKNDEQNSSKVKGIEKEMSETQNGNKETSEVGNAKKEPSKTSDNSSNLPFNVVKDRGKIVSDVKDGTSSDVSVVRNKCDFKETAKYRDVESYAEQHHHSIGEGLYMTDEIRDLPPRFRTKVMQALENALAMHNVKIDRNPLEYFTSYGDDAKELDKNRDKLVYIPPYVLEDEKKGSEKSDSAKNYSPSKTNFIKEKSSDSRNHLNFDCSSNNLEGKKLSCSNVNWDSRVPSQSVRSKSGIKSESQPSRTNSDHLNSYTRYSSSFSDKKTSGPIRNDNDSNGYTRISTAELFSSVKPGDKVTLVSNNTVKGSCTASSVCDASSLELNKRFDGNSHKDSGINANKNTYKKRGIDSKMQYKYSDRQNTPFDDNKNSFKSQSKYSTVNSTSSYENKFHEHPLKTTNFYNNYADSSTRSNTHTAELTKGVKSDSSQFQSDEVSGKNKASKYKANSESLNRYQNASKSSDYAKKDKFSKSKNISSENFDPPIQPPNTKNYYNKNKMCTTNKILGLPSEKKESDMVQDLSLKNPSVQSKRRKTSDSHSSVSSSYSPKSYDNVPLHNPQMVFQDKSINAVNSFHNSSDPFSHKKTMCQQFDRGSNFSKRPNNNRYQDKYSDSSSVFSDKSVRTYNSSDSIPSFFGQNEKSISDKAFNRTNDNYFKSSNYKHFDESGGKKFSMNSKQSARGRRVLDSKYNSRSAEENCYHSNKTHFNSNKSSYAEECDKRRLKELENKKGHRVCTEIGFFVKVEVSEKATDLEYWIKYFQKTFSFPFELVRCCHFSDILILEFERKEHANRGIEMLYKEKKALQNLKKPHFLQVSTVLNSLTKPCNCREKVIRDCTNSIEKHFESSLHFVDNKVEEIVSVKPALKKINRRDEVKSAEHKILKSFEKSKSRFSDFKNQAICDVENAENLRTIQQLKHSFLRECNTFKRCLPIYSQKKEILDLAKYRSVSVIVAETGSGKSTQLVEYVLHSAISENGLIICTQPRKLAAITIAQFVSGQLGSAVGKIVGYDVGIEKKYSNDLTKIIYMTDYCLLKYFLSNRNLKGVSCVIIDEAHERSLYTDLILGLLKKCLDVRRDLCVLITSATINPTIFVNYFNMPPECVIEVPGRTYPVDVVWYSSDVEIGWDYLHACVRQAHEIHMNQKEGDILVFLTSPSEAEEAIYLFKRLSSNKNKKFQLLSLHGKSDIEEQMLIFQKTSVRKIIFATNVAETAVTIPGIKYVVDSGMSKELMFDSQKNKSYLAVTFATKSAAEQRKGRAGRTQSGICYRMYSERNYTENMADNVVPEILKSNLQKALLKIFELGIDPENFDFIESPPARTISNSVESLEHLGAVQNKRLTEFGRKLGKLPLEPQLSKLILQGIAAKIGIEAIIIAVLVSESSKLFIRSEDNRAIADEKKRKFCHEGGDLCTYLEIYKRWKEVDIPKRYAWCVDNFFSFKALNAARKTVKEILITLRSELGIHVSSEYNNNDFKKQYEKIIFDSFSENLCVLSGHPKLGYLSPYLSESFFIHPSSTLSYLGKDSPEFLVYSTLMETSRNFLFDLTPISETVLKSAYQTGKFPLPVHTLKCLQVPPKKMGPFGESVIIRHILGKGGVKIKDLEKTLMHLTRVKNLYIDVDVTKGLITIHISHKLHEKVENHIQQIIDVALAEMLKEEDVAKLTGACMYFALGAGGIINDVIMPGEFRELIFKCVRSKDSNELENALQIYGPLQSFSHVTNKQDMQIHATFKKVCDAEKAFLNLKGSKKYNVSPKPYLPDVSDKKLHMLLLSWCRSPSTGFGLVEFFSEEDLIEASGSLTCNSFFVGNNLIMFLVDQADRTLSMKNLPEYVEEQTIREKLKENLPHIKIKCIKIHRKNVKITQAAIDEAKKKLSKLLSLYVSSAKFTIDLKYPEREALWNAYVYFDSAVDSENAFMKLKGNTCIDSYPLSIRQIFKFKLYCNEDVFSRFSVQIKKILKTQESKGICDDFSIKSSQRKFSIEFTCVSLEKLYKTKQSLQKFVEGEYLEFIGNSKYHFLFTDCFAEEIKKIQKSTNTLINLDKFKKGISIYGSFRDCRKATEEIYLLSYDPDCFFTRTFNLTDSCIPNGFLKHLYSKYGYNLQGLAASFKLTVASIDGNGSTLTLKGVKQQIRQAEQALEKLCEELFQTKGERRKASNDEEACPICLDPVSYAFQRLEHCGHAFCRQCLLLQLESKTMPLVCVKQDCGKLIFLEDIKRIISFGGDHLKKSFCAVALQYHVSCNIGKLSYCRTPDCQMIYRITKEGSEYKCPSCKISTCTQCQLPYHFGMSCEMFQKCQEDEDYPLKMWVKENENSRKYCPSCKTVIEKVDGCNHMECLNCKAHLCWLCLQIFESGDEVYSHMPYCPKNQ